MAPRQVWRSVTSWRVLLYSAATLEILPTVQTIPIRSCIWPTRIPVRAWTDLIFGTGMPSAIHTFSIFPCFERRGCVCVGAQNGKGLPVFVNCTFRDNVAKSRGGAIFVHGQNSSGSTPIFRNCLFYNNKAQYAGGALFISGGNDLDRGIEFDHCYFESNTAGFFGGAISMENAFGSEMLNFLSCTITKGHANVFGGFMYMIKSGPNASKITIDSCEISKNTSNGGPCALYVTSNGDNFQTVFKLRNSKVFDNFESSVSFGGVISSRNLPISLFNY